MNAQIRDWVRFYQGGRLVIGEVKYIKKDEYSTDKEYQTDIGAVDSEYVLEVRKPKD